MKTEEKKEEEIICIHCNRVFQSLQGLRIHDASHRKNNLQPITYPLRQKIENSTRDMERYKINSEIQKNHTQQHNKKEAVNIIKDVLVRNSESLLLT